MDENTTNEQVKLNMGPIVLTGVISVVLLFIIVVAVEVWFYNVQSAEDEKKIIQQDYRALLDLNGSQEMRLASYGWIDKKKKIVHVPIDRAMAKYLDRVRAADR